MIIIDNNQIILASIFANIRNGDIDEDIIRHMVLNTYRLYRNKFKNKYGELVIANDSKDCWRRDYYPLYKASRRKDQKKSHIDWNEIYRLLNLIREEIKTVFPYKNLAVERTEADDIIAVLVKRYHTTENIVIVSNDKDFQQLQRYPNVSQYSPLKKSMLVCNNPEKFLIDHIIKGDVSDGIPNILSDDDVFMDEDKRQKPCGKKKIGVIKEDLKSYNTTPNWERNNRMINLNMIPEDIESQIIDEFDIEPVHDSGKVFNYFIEKKLRRLMEDIQEFV